MTSQKENRTPQILLAGDIYSAFVSPDAAEALNARKCSKISDALDLAAGQDFALIGIIMSGTAAGLESMLQSLRRVSGKSKIVLLAQMYHEPLAMKFVQGDRNGKGLADDYLICPVVAGDFDKWLGLTAVREPQEKELIDRDSRLAERIRELEKLATEDDLTGLKNRRYIWEFGRQIIDRAKRTSGRVTVLIFDIDDFKHYNDRYGHPAGDDILKQAATLIQRCCRRHDVVGRIGGDEFAVVFWDDPRRPDAEVGDERRSSSDHPKEAVFIAERFREQLEKAEFNLLGPGGKGVLTISGGLASFPRDGDAIEKLFQKADEALLEAKKSGKNQIYLVGKPNPD
jgi:diguanylate cyclase (GGDEF)-like protein